MSKFGGLILGIMWSGVIQAAGLSCQYFDLNSEIVQSERQNKINQYAQREIDSLTDEETQELNLASSLSGKTVCEFSGSLKAAWAEFRADKSYGLGNSLPNFPTKKPRLPYQKTHHNQMVKETWILTAQKHGFFDFFNPIMILKREYADEFSQQRDITVFRPVKNGKIEIERKFYAS